MTDGLDVLTAASSTSLLFLEKPNCRDEHRELVASGFYAKCGGGHNNERNNPTIESITPSRIRIHPRRCKAGSYFSPTSTRYQEHNSRWQGGGCRVGRIRR